MKENLEYKAWLTELKAKIRSAQFKAAVTVNTQLIEFYWDLGKMIANKQKIWGSHFLENLSKDLKAEFPEMEGFSVTSLKYCRMFYNFFSGSPQVGDDLKESISPRVGDELGSESLDIVDWVIFSVPWGHIKLIIGKIKDLDEAIFYLKQTIENS